MTRVGRKKSGRLQLCSAMRRSVFYASNDKVGYIEDLRSSAITLHDERRKTFGNQFFLLAQNMQNLSVKEAASVSKFVAEVIRQTLIELRGRSLNCKATSKKHHCRFLATETYSCRASDVLTRSDETSRTIEMGHPKYFIQENLVA